MRCLILIKTLYRTPFKTLMTFLILGTVMFALFSKVGEYSITQREIENAAQEYRGIGSAEIAPAGQTYPGIDNYINADPRLSKEYGRDIRYQPLSRDQITAIHELLNGTSVNTRYMTAGVSDVYYRLDEGEDFYNYTARFIIEATLLEVGPYDECI